MKTAADEIAALTRQISETAQALATIRSDFKNQIKAVDEKIEATARLKDLNFVSVDQQAAAEATANWLQERRQLIRVRNEETRHLARTIKDCRFRIDALLDDGPGQHLMELKD